MNDEFARKSIIARCTPSRKSSYRYLGLFRA